MAESLCLALARSVYTNFIADPPGDAESAAADGDATEKEAAASKPSARIR
jgi:hypothetical protein